jgi:hypothetical protein
MEKNALCVSLLGGQFKAVALRKGAFDSRWEYPLAVDDMVLARAVLRDALLNTGAEGKSITVVLAHPRLIDQVVEVPPVKHRMLDRLLQRRAEGMKTFTGDVAWSRQGAIPTRKGQGWLLHVFPRVLLDQLGRGCDQVDRQLVRVLPTTAVLAAHLKQLPIARDEVALLIADSGPTTTIVIGRNDGRVCLARVLQFRGSEHPDRLHVDLTRSIGFAEQQSGLTVQSVWVFGEFAEAQVPGLQAQLKLSVQVSPVAWSPFYWAEQAGRMPEREDGNLVSAESRQAPQRRRLVAVTALLLFLLLGAAVGTAVVLDRLRSSDLEGIATMKTQIQELETQRNQLQRELTELERLQEITRVVSDERVPPLPGWFLAYLGQVIPDDLLVTQLDVTRTNDLWSVRLSGTSQPGAARNGAPGRDLAQATAALASNLATGPLRLNVTRTVPELEVESAPTRPGSARTRTPAPRAVRTSGVGVPPGVYVIEGTIP